EIEKDKLSYNELIRILKQCDIKQFLYTIEFFPEEGRYHFDGHRACGIVFEPKTTIKHKGICPKCRRPLTIGVEYRVEELADREVGYVPNNKPGYKRLIELDKIIAQAMGVKGRKTKTVLNVYWDMIKKLKNELFILLDVSLAELKNTHIDSRVIEGIRRVREGDLYINPGYDGVYGEIRIFKDAEVEKRPGATKVPRGQKSLF
ncbi:endonuclease Q family protein, partial [Patescibacteria group bacterium AH-259-L07]|nr:endonuclease Q family protein [Patescibacteria group bacterium AH-259-L07]